MLDNDLMLEFLLKKIQKKQRKLHQGAVSAILNNKETKCDKE